MCVEFRPEPTKDERVEEFKAKLEQAYKSLEGLVGEYKDIAGYVNFTIGWDPDNGWFYGSASYCGSSEEKFTEVSKA